VHPRFEGGQTPLVKRLPHIRGFRNPFTTDYCLVNLRRLEVFEGGSEVTPEKLRDAGIVGSLKRRIKILGDGDLDKPLIVKANRFSQAAKRKIEAAGGRAEEIR
jgi:large subunit ribosomal protein L15